MAPITLLLDVFLILASTACVSSSPSETLLRQEANLMIQFKKNHAIGEHDEAKTKFHECLHSVDQVADKEDATQLDNWLEHDYKYAEEREKLSSKCDEKECPQKWTDLFEEQEKKTLELESSYQKVLNGLESDYKKCHSEYAKTSADIDSKLDEEVEKIESDLKKDLEKIEEEEQKDIEKWEKEVRKRIDEMNTVIKEDLCCEFEGVERQLEPSEIPLYNEQFEKALKFSMHKCGLRYKVYNATLTNQTFEEHSSTRRDARLRGTEENRALTDSGTWSTSNTACIGPCSKCPPIPLPGASSLRRNLQLSPFLCNGDEFAKKFEHQLTVHVKDIFQKGSLRAVTCGKCA